VSTNAVDKVTILAEEKLIPLSFALLAEPDNLLFIDFQGAPPLTWDIPIYTLKNPRSFG